MLSHFFHYKVLPLELFPTIAFLTRIEMVPKSPESKCLFALGIDRLSTLDRRFWPQKCSF